MENYDEEQVTMSGTKDTGRTRSTGVQRASAASRKTVVAYYEQHKSEFSTKAGAAYRIFEQNLVPFKYSTIYAWLDKHIGKLKK